MNGDDERDYAEESANRTAMFRENMEELYGEQWPMYVTTDGVHIVDGMEAYDYDRECVTVTVTGTWADPTDPFHEYWRGMFDVVTLNGRRKLMDASRLSTVCD